MQVPHNAVVLVADGRKILLLRNEGDGEYPNLKVQDAQEHPNPRTGDQATDSAGRSASASSTGTSSAGGPGGGEGGHAGAARSSIEPTDFHQLEEDRFAAEVAEMLRKQALARKFDKLVVVAPPRTLGELRKHYHKEVEDRLLLEVAKDLTNHQVSDIEAALQAA